MAAYEQACAGQPKEIGSKRTIPGTIGALAVSYYNSLPFCSYFASSPRNAMTAFESIATKIAASTAYREQVCQSALDLWEIEKVLDREDNMAVIAALVRPPAD
jgi:hypothetical protein